jgi:hypothetical protein
VSGGGDAILAAEGTSTHALEGDLYFQDRLLAPFALAGPGSVPAQPAVAEGETGHATAAWFAAAGTVHARGFEDGKAADPEAPVTDPALGPVDGTAGLFAGSDRFANTVIGFVQGTGAGRRLALAVWDRAPTSVLQTTSVNWRRAEPLNWGAVEEHWGDITYAVFIDGRPVGTTTLPTMPIAGHVTDGLHTWRVTATDQHGQSVSSIRRSLRIDTTGPNVSVSITGKRTAGTSLKITVHARDAHAGLQVVKVDFGEGGAPAFGRVVRHTYGAGSHTVTVKAVDRAGNATVVVRRVTVRR